MGSYKYTWIPDLPDFRDRIFMVSEAVPLPEMVDLREKCPEIYDQMDMGSCTANAGAEAIKFLEIKNNITPLEDVSRLFLYYVTRSLDGSTRYDNGASLRATAKAINKFGVCNENLWTYDTKNRKFAKKPSPAAYKDATNHKSIEYRRVRGMQDIKTVLALGLPIIFGFTVYSSFETKAVTETGIVPMPTRRDRERGGHASLIVGYDNENEWFICQNSWGLDWGSQGFFFLPYDYLPMMADFWVISKVDNY